MTNSPQPATNERYLIDLDGIDMDQTWAGPEDIEAVNPHRGEMRHLDRVIWWNEDRTEAVGIKEVGDDEFWVPGHIPGRPLFPGVLQIEAGAQLSSFVLAERFGDAPFVGFTRVTDCSFRGQVVPGDEMILFTKEVKVNRRRFITDIQGIVNDKIVFEARITGMAF
ncbi:MAG: beta-hydroxyacyl-ACP dehydratase [Planctomycetota bacterium]|nr:beta-hydroxyacyl-ACP dehydratase [Planctomycetota bacterium]MEC8734816.1 beta-hydroxyacyl-ACP dehydratase [Planctomycetota bacterium]MEC9157740.1 beta-hydroxyacyl-ACP dehydratase [Planctomycetota bacterium]MED5508562.1 beta-hydroxyacyl-ACP dehydratase [Planctomycetota bacterium]MED6306782.1 beta-hydroxyacyl-ACP dehydratase [Planctomycetota bacterium]